MTTEPSPYRDPGPYQSTKQALQQATAILHDITQLQAPGAAGELLLMEALTLTGVQVSGWEDVQRLDLVRALPLETVQTIAGWILRAHLAGWRIDPQENHTGV